jgi:tetratricopeptide (TPR) repeat protein
VNFHPLRANRLLSLLTLSLAVCLAAFGDNATNAPPPDLSQLLEAGKAFQKAAEEAKTPGQAADNYQKAIEQFSHAATVAPDSYHAHFLYGHSLYTTALHTTDRGQRRTLILAAREQYRAAAPCAGVDWLLYREWGAMLTNEIDLLAGSTAERRAILEEAIDSLNAGLNLTRFSVERATIERELGVALLLRAKSSPASPGQRALYKQAIEKFESATKVGTEAKTARIYGLWGVALLEIGKGDNDRMLMGQAVERLQTALDMDAANVEIRYTLACAYALLDQPEAGMRHLKTCLESDPDRTYYRAASKDPDLANLRGTAEYNQIFSDESSVDPQTIIRSQISDH